MKNSSLQKKLITTIILVVILAVMAIGGCTASGSKGAGDTGASAGNAAATSLSQDAGESQQPASGEGTGVPASTHVDESGTYTSKDEVALYVHEYGHLPSNYISKTKARKAGWDSSEGNLQEVCPGKSIGGSRFYDEDAQLPAADGRTWTECDIDYEGGFRGSKRVIFSNDGLVYYTDDHYQTFTRIF